MNHNVFLKKYDEMFTNHLGIIPHIIPIISSDVVVLSL